MTTDELPTNLGELDRRLRAVQFEPRASLGAEVAGRARRGEMPAVIEHPWRWFAARCALAVGGVAALAALVASFPQTHRFDICCHDLDGLHGGRHEGDGMVVVRDWKGEVNGLLIYEDRDGSRSHTDADVVRFVRGSATGGDAPHETGSANTFVHCCADLDGEGPADDGVMIMGTLPDRISYAALIRYDGLRQIVR